MSFLLTILLLVIIFACVAATFRDGMWSNAIRLINVVTAALLAVNERLWVIEDEIRDKERAQAFDVTTKIQNWARKFAYEVIAPLNRVGDTHGALFKDGAVTMPPGWKEAYRNWAAAGWNGLSAPVEWGGQGRPPTPSTRR